MFNPNIKAVLSGLVLASTTIIAPMANAADNEIKIEEIHFLVPGGAGGGWDGTARGTGEALSKSGIVGKVSYQNMSGGGGGKAIAHLIETAKQSEHTLMINSTPIVVRSLTKIFPQSFRDLTPIAATISDYGALIVREDSKYTTWDQVITDFKADNKSVKVSGGSAKGSLDHLVAAAAFKNSGMNPLDVRYVAYDAGGKAMAGLLSGETQMLSTGLGEALEMSKAGQVRVLAITAPERLSDVPDVPTLKEMGSDTVFANWRGFFAPPGTSPEKAKAYADAFEAMYDTPEWEVVRKRNGWVNTFKPNDEFMTFLEEQETTIGDLMKEMGFLR